MRTFDNAWLRMNVVIDEDGKNTRAGRMLGEIKEGKELCQELGARIIKNMNIDIDNPMYYSMSVHKFVRIRSGGKTSREQAFHADYPQHELDDTHYTCFPLSVIVAVDDMKIIVLLGSAVGKESLTMRFGDYETEERRREVENRVRQGFKAIIRVPAGHAFIFRGDLIHAGASYDQPVDRVHFYVLNDRVKKVREIALLKSKVEMMEKVIKDKLGDDFKISSGRKYVQITDFM